MNKVHTFQIDCHDKLGELPGIWRSFGYDEINWTYTPRGKRLFRDIGQLAAAPYYIRCHHSFTTGNGLSTPTKGSTNVCTEVSGRGLQPNFTLLDRVVETFLANGCRPVIELGFMPDALASGPTPKPRYDYQGSDQWRRPPRDYKKWQELVHLVVAHFVVKYGSEEVSTWYWEVWNEPDNPGFFSGSVRDYCKIYDYAVAGAAAALPGIQIGGPALASNPQFLHKFLRHCAEGRNRATGGRGARLDFISLHAKGTDWPLAGQPCKMPSLAKIFSHLQSYVAVLAQFGQFDGLPVLLDECDMAVATNFGMFDFPEYEFNNTEYYPVFVLRMAKYLLDFAALHKLPLRFFTTWAFYFEGKRFFEGNRALVTNENIRKPVFNAFAMLEMLGKTRLGFASPNQDLPRGEFSVFRQVDGLATLNDAGSIVVLLWNFDESGASSEVAVQLNLTNLPFSNGAEVSMQRVQIDKSRSNSYAAWQRLGCPQDPTPQQIAELEKRQELEAFGKPEFFTVAGGAMQVALELPGQSACLLRLEGK